MSDGFSRIGKSARCKLCVIGALAANCLTGCGGKHPPSTTHSQPPAQTPPTTDPALVSIPESVRRSLGITFARAELRQIQSTVRLPGFFELATDARRDYASPMAGHVELHVALGAEVTTGQLLFTVTSPALRETWTAWSAAQAKTASTSASLIQAISARRGANQATSFTLNRASAGARHKESLRLALAAAKTEYEQMSNLQSRFGGKVVELNEARTRYAAAQAALRLAEEETLDTERDLLLLTTEGSGSFGTIEYLDALVQARHAEFAAAQAEARNLEQTLNALLQQAHKSEHLPQSQLNNISENGGDLGRLPFHAAGSGTVRDLAVHSGRWVEPETTLLSVVAQDRVVFRANVPQGDALRLTPNTPTYVLHPDKPREIERLPVQWNGIVAADPKRRVQEILFRPLAPQPWAIEGVSSYAESVLDASEESQVCIPVAAITQDGLDKILFRRDPNDPDKVRRIRADLGLSDGQWIVMESGVGEGDEVVIGGIHQLRLATQGQKTITGHFHADGTYHEGEH